MCKCIIYSYSCVCFMCQQCVIHNSEQCAKYPVASRGSRYLGLQCFAEVPPPPPPPQEKNIFCGCTFLCVHTLLLVNGVRSVTNCGLTSCRFMVITGTCYYSHNSCIMTGNTFQLQADCFSRLLSNALKPAKSEPWMNYRDDVCTHTHTQKHSLSISLSRSL